MLEYIDALHKRYPDADYSQLRASFENEHAHEYPTMRRTSRNYMISCETVQARMNQWIQEGMDARHNIGLARGEGVDAGLVVTDTRQLLRALGSRRPAFVWCTAFGMSRSVPGMPAAKTTVNVVDLVAAPASGGSGEEGESGSAAEGAGEGEIR